MGKDDARPGRIQGAVPLCPSFLNRAPLVVSADSGRGSKAVTLRSCGLHLCLCQQLRSYIISSFILHMLV